MSQKHSKQSLEQAMLTLAPASREELVALWTSRNGYAPPKGCGRTLLELAEAYAIQSLAHGGLKLSLRRKLVAKPNGNSGIGVERKAQTSRRLTHGSKLVREWHGRTHHVDVVQGGFVWNGNKHHSLSAIAKEITGAHWSGPRFFGL